MKKRIVVAISGASGVIYGTTLIKELLARPIDVHVIITQAGRKIVAHELNHRGDVASFIKKDSTDYVNIGQGKFLLTHHLEKALKNTGVKNESLINYGIQSIKRKRKYEFWCIFGCTPQCFAR